MRKLLCVMVLLMLAGVTAFAQVAGDYRSVKTGSWDSVSTWERFDGSNWVAASAFPNDSTASVTIGNDDTVVVQTSARRLFNLTIQPGALLYANTGNTTSNFYLRLYGATLQNNGRFGVPVDGLGFEFRNNLTLTGSGTNYICRIRPVQGTYGKTLTFGANATITYQGGSGTGGSGVYALNTSGDSITFVVPLGKTITFVTYSNFATGSSTTTDQAINCDFVIDGTVNMEGNSNFSMRTTAGKTARLTVNGTLNVGRNLYLSTATGGPNVLTVNTGGVLNVGTGIPGTCEFGNPLAVVTGGGTFSLASGEKLQIGSPDGITASAAAGPIQTAVRNFSTGALYEYMGTAAQVTGDGLPATVGGLIVNNPAGLTLTNPLTVTGATAFTAGKLVAGTMGLKALGTVTSAGAGKFVDGKLYRLMNAPGLVTWDVGNGADYLPFSVAIQTISGGDTVGVWLEDRRVTPPAAKISDTSKVLRRYYRIADAEGITELTPDSMVVSYAGSDVVEAGLGEDTLQVYSSDGIFWSKEQKRSADTVANQISIESIQNPLEVIVSGKAPQNFGTVLEARQYPVGTEVGFMAVVTRAKGAFSYMQDSTAGMTVRQTSGAWFDSVSQGRIRPGTVVKVLGVTSEFNSLKQINTTDLKAFKVEEDSSWVPEPIRLTLAEIKAEGEKYEAMLVKVINVRILTTDTVFAAARTYTITDPSDTTKAVALRTPNAADGDVDGMKVFPVITFTGVIGQFSSSNPAAGYQLMAINPTDVTDNALAVEETPAGVPASFVLHNAYPNPFNPSTTIVYGLPAQSKVTVKVYSVLGQEVRTLVNEVQGASYQRVSWDGRDASGRSVSSGMYFLRVVAEPVGGGPISVDTKKMMLMK